MSKMNDIDVSLQEAYIKWGCRTPEQLRDCFAAMMDWDMLQWLAHSRDEAVAWLKKRKAMVTKPAKDLPKAADK